MDANATALQLAQQLAAEDKKQVEIGTLRAAGSNGRPNPRPPPARPRCSAAKQALVVQENTLKSLLTERLPANGWTSRGQPAEELVAVPQLLDRQESWRRALTERPEMVEDQLKTEKAKHHAQIRFQPALPATGRDRQLWPKRLRCHRFNDNLSDLSRGNATFYSVGAVFSMPLGGNSPPATTTSPDKATLKQLLLQFKQEEQNVLVAIGQQRRPGSVHARAGQIQRMTPGFMPRTPSGAEQTEARKRQKHQLQRPPAHLQPHHRARQ